MKEDAHAVVRQALGGQQIPGQVAFLAGIAWPVEVDRDSRCLHALAYGLGEACQLFGTFFLMAQQHEESTQLSVLDLAVEQHAHGLAGFFACQVAGATLAFAENAHEGGERMFCWGFDVHRQLLGFGSPASLAASLAGVPLNRRLRCMLLPFSAPSLSAVYLISGRVAGDS